TLTEEDAPVAFISGGVGITPMLSMFEQLIDEKSTRDITFLHAAQNEKLHAFHEDVKEMVAAAENAKYVYGYSNPINEGGEQDFNGFINKEVLENIKQEDMIYYVVGPVPMMEQDRKSTRLNSSH